MNVINLFIGAGLFVNLFHIIPAYISLYYKNYNLNCQMPYNKHLGYFLNLLYLKKLYSPYPLIPTRSYS